MVPSVNRSNTVGLDSPSNDQHYHDSAVGLGPQSKEEERSNPTRSRIGEQPFPFAESDLDPRIGDRPRGERPGVGDRVPVEVDPRHQRTVRCIHCSLGRSTIAPRPVAVG